MVAYKTVPEVIAAIGNVVAHVEIDAVLFTLAADAVVRVNDADTGEIIARIACTSQGQAESSYATLTTKARRMAGEA